MSGNACNQTSVSDFINQLVYQGKQRKHVTVACGIQRTGNHTFGSVQRCIYVAVELVSEHTSFSFLT